LVCIHAEGAHEARRRGAVPDSQALILSNNSTLKAKLPALKKYEILLFKTAEIFFEKPYKKLDADQSAIST